MRPISVSQRFFRGQAASLGRFSKASKALGERYGQTALLALGLALTAVFSFQGGYLQGLSRQPEPLIIEKPALPTSATTVSGAGAIPPQTASGAPAPALPADCAFVGSRHSNKYHAPTSRCAKQIKPENRVCFGDAEEAAKRGYVQGCLE